MGDLSPISLEESRRLLALEKVIKAGLSTFTEVGEALSEIRDGKLYKSDYSSFDAYCSERWGMKRAHASRLIGAAVAVSNLSPIGDTPQTESQARPLTKLKDPAQQQAAWNSAVTASNGKPTAKHVEAAVAEISAGRPIPAPTFTPEQQAVFEETENDSEKLWALKTAWRRAGKKDRATFLAWTKNSDQ